MTFTYLRRGCPVCGGIRKDCRQNNENQIIHCRHADANPVGFKFLGQDKIGSRMWLKSAIVDEQDKQRREEWREEQRQKRELREKLERQRKAEGLTEVERDRSFRNLLGQLSLSPKHREDLLRRGLRGGQIREGMFASVKKWQRLNSPVSHLLPGVNLDGRSLNIGYSGYLCPIWKDGLIIGCQVRLDNAENGKYRWLTSVNKRRPNGQTSHLKNGELPITLVEADDDKDLRFAEGVLKPDVASCRLEKNFLGAAGGQFAKSPFQVKSAIARLNPERLILCPDAEAVKNKNVMRSYQALHDLLSSLGHELWVEWWGQFDKSSPDIDELSPETQTQIISYQDFLDLAQRNSHSSNQILPFSNRKSKNENWLKAKKLTPTQTINKKYFDFDSPLPDSIYFIKSGLGSGKTHWLCKKLAELKGKYGAIALGKINTLLLQFTEQKATWFYHLREHDAGMFINDPLSCLALCIDSLYRFDPEDFDGKIVILDECNSIVRQLLSPWLKDKQDEIIEKFVECLKRAAIVICLDGDLDDSYSQYLAQLAQKTNIFKIENLQPPEPLDITFLEGVVDEKGREKTGNYSYFLNLIKNYSGSPDLISDWANYEKETLAHNIAVSSDSRIFCEAIERDVKEINPDYEIIKITSKTTPTQEIKLFLKNPDHYLKYLAEQTGKPILLIYSPSAESGVDISLKGFFSYHFHFGFCLGADTQTQMLVRLRDPQCKRYVWLREYSVAPNEEISYSSRQFEAVKRYQIESDCTTELIPEDFIEDLRAKMMASFDSPHFKMSCYLDRMASFEKSHLRECVRAKLEQAGHKLTETWSADFQPRRDELKRMKKEVKIEESEQIFQAPDLTDTQAKFISKAQTNATWEERCQVKKHYLKNTLPDIENSEFWSVDTVKKLVYDSPQLINQLTLKFFLNNPQIAKTKQTCFWDRVNYSSHNVYLGNFRSYYQQVQALIELGVPELVAREGEEIREDDEMILKIHKTLKKWANKASAAFRPGKTPLKTLTRICRRLGIDYRRKQYRDEEDQTKRKNSYVIQPPSRLSQDIYQRIETRQKRIEQESTPFPNQSNSELIRGVLSRMRSPNPEEIPSKSAGENEGAKTGSTTVRERNSAVTFFEVSSIEKESFCDKAMEKSRPPLKHLAQDALKVGDRVKVLVGLTKEECGTVEAINPQDPIFPYRVRLDDNFTTDEPLFNLELL